MKETLLFIPQVTELSQKERTLVTEALEIYKNDPWHMKKNARFSPKVNASFYGFYIDRNEQKAFPVYKTDNGYFAIDHTPAVAEESGGSVREWRVNMVDVYIMS